MRVAISSWRDLAHPQAGGSEVVVDRVARGLVELGSEVVLFAGGPTAPRPYDVVDTGGRWTQYLLAPPAVWRRGPFDVVLDVQNGVPFFSPLWTRAPAVCLVHHVHVDQWRQHFGPAIATLGSLLERRLMPVVYRRFIAISPSTADGLAGLGVSRDRVKTIVMGTEQAHRQIVVGRSAEPLFVCLGRLVPHKRVELVLQAWRHVRPRTGGTLLVVGDGPSRRALEQQNTPGVVFTGRVSDDEKWDILARSWLLVHGAHHEGWGVVVNEAGSVATPSLAFDVPGVRDAVEPGISGVLVHSIEGFIQAWTDLARDSAERRRLGEGAAMLASRHPWAESVRQVHEVLSAMAGLE